MKKFLKNKKCFLIVAISLPQLRLECETQRKSGVIVR